MNGAPLIDTSQIPSDSLESIRNRLNQVHLSLRKLADQINHHNRHPTKVKLPNYAHFQNQFQVLITQLQLIAQNLSTNDDLLKHSNVHPTPSFPTTQQEGLVTTLLRKKPLPEVDEWVERALKSDVGVGFHDEFSQWCFAKVQELRDEFQFYGFHTVEELDFMETPEGKAQSEKNNEIEAKKDRAESTITAGGKKGFTPNQVHKFMYQGLLE